jgi:pimeloyl-ACP methyl ester carboxylesterase
MERPGIKLIQYTLFKNYSTNFPLYEQWQNYLRTHQPPVLIVWGKRDQIFTAPGAQAYLQDVAEAELHLLDGGHFLLEEHHAAIAELMKDFLQRRL